MNATAPQTEATPAERLDAFIEAHGLSFVFVFVPYSQARDKRKDWSEGGADGKPWEGLTWAVTISKAGRPFLLTDYSAGIAHAPAYNAKPLEGGMRGHSRSYTEALRRNAIKAECETGKIHQFGDHYRTDSSGILNTRKDVPPPLGRDVLWSLAQDSSVLDSGGFENWAADYGYDTDSRKAEAIYKACLEIGLKLRAALGDAAMRELQEAGQDY